MSELKPCPFCGNKNIRKNFGIFPELFCSECEATIYAYDEHEDLAKSWNTRPLEDALQARIAELEAQLRWIPVSERLPEEDGEYLIFWQCKHGKGIEIDVYSTSLGWHDVDSDLHTHWMPLPNLPEDGN